MDLKNKKDLVFLILACFFITNVIVAELIGGKLIMFFGLFTQSIGIILWPIVFILTDVINEHFGKDGVKKLTYITAVIVSVIFLILAIAMQIPATSFSPVSDKNFNAVFGQSNWIIVGSIIAFILAQLIDVYVFAILKKTTGNKHIWMRATVSTLISQLIDTFVVQYVAFVLPEVWSMNELLINASYGYLFKLIIAICMIPFLYLVHFIVSKVYLKQLT